jgi:ribosomal protein S4
MGVYKGLYLQKTNRKVILRVKSYSYYRKDIWGLLRWKKLFKHKKAVYNILKIVRKFYNIILQQVYKGVHFNVKRYGYVGTLFFAKRLLRLYYGNLRESFFGRLGRLVKRKSGVLINYFFGLLERRLDVLLVRTFFTNKVIWARRYIIFVNIFVSKLRVNLPNFLVRVGDVISIKSSPAFLGFFNFNKDTFSVKDFRSFKKYRGVVKKIRLTGLTFLLSNIRRVYFFHFRSFLKRAIFRKLIFLRRLGRKFLRGKYITRRGRRWKHRRKIKRTVIKTLILKKKTPLKNVNQRFLKRLKLLRCRYFRLVKKRIYSFKRFFFKIKVLLRKLFKNSFRFFFKNSFVLVLRFIRKLRIFKRKRLFILKNCRRFFLLLQLLLSERHGDQGSSYLYCFFRASLSRYLVFQTIGGSIPIQRRKFLLLWSSSFLRAQIFFSSLATRDDYVYVRRFRGIYLKGFLLFRKIRVTRLLLRKFLFNRKYKAVKNRGGFNFVRDGFEVYLNKEYKCYRFSLAQYRLLKQDRSFYFSPVSPFLEINYKVRKFTVFKIPSPAMLRYPFGIRNTFLYTYYKRRAFF